MLWKSPVSATTTVRALSWSSWVDMGRGSKGGVNADAGGRRGEVAD